MASAPDHHDTLALPFPGPPEQAGYAGPAKYGAYSQPHLGAPPAVAPPAVWSQVPPYPKAAPAPVIRTNNAAVVGATLGSISLFLSVIPLFGLLAWVLAPIGVVSSAVGLVVGVSRQAGRVGAIFGLVTSGVALLICCAWLFLLLAL